MKRRGADKGPSEQDLDLFQKVVADVKPLDPARKALPQGQAKEKPKNGGNKQGSTDTRRSVRPPEDPNRTSFPAALADHGAGRAPGLDRRSALRLKRGKMEIDGRIDLHGMTQEEAHRALAGFVTTGHRHGRRCLLVITGKGRRGTEGRDASWSGDGVLRRMVPRWLSETPLDRCVVAYSPAQPEHGGSGALYVLLKRRRDP